MPLRKGQDLKQARKLTEFRLAESSLVKLLQILSSRILQEDLAKHQLLICTVLGRWVSTTDFISSVVV